jgi:3-methyladenine DNA glycosylase AlkD
MANAQAVLKQLKAKARPDQLEGMARYALVGKKRLGISIPELRKMAKEIGQDHQLALKLWKSGIQEGRILAGMIDEPDAVTEKQLESWVKDFDSWDVCDQVCMNLFAKTPFARMKIDQWSRREEEFVKRTAFALIACLAWHDKQAPDRDFTCFFPIIKRAATDDRNFVKKAVNWALRNIGKRNLRLNGAAIKIAKELQQLDSKAARWIASGAIRELKSDAVQKRLKT